VTVKNSFGRTKGIERQPVSYTVVPLFLRESKLLRNLRVPGKRGIPLLLRHRNSFPNRNNSKLIHGRRNRRPAIDTEGYQAGLNTLTVLNGSRVTPKNLWDLNS